MSRRLGIQQKSYCKLLFRCSVNDFRLPTIMTTMIAMRDVLLNITSSYI